MKTMAIIYKNQKAREDESSTTAAAKAELNDLKQAKAKQSINQSNHSGQVLQVPRDHYSDRHATVQQTVSSKHAWVSVSLIYMLLKTKRLIQIKEIKRQSRTSWPNKIEKLAPILRDEEIESRWGRDMHGCWGDVRRPAGRPTNREVPAERAKKLVMMLLDRSAAIFLESIQRKRPKKQLARVCARMACLVDMRISVMCIAGLDTHALLPFLTIIYIYMSPLSWAESSHPLWFRPHIKY